MNPAATLLEVAAAHRRPRKNSSDGIQVEGDGNDFDGSGFEGLQMKNKNKRTMEGVDEECRRIKTEMRVSKKVLFPSNSAIMPPDSRFKWHLKKKMNGKS